ncbi:MAG TPA: class II fumarate hydratase [Planctomycetota bacterium]|nr:class II fumarate hydratase [Planctomycetota bacterium]
MAFRTETDSLGPVQVPAEAFFGAQTQRAVENFPISGQRMPARFVRAIILIKKAAAQANRELGQLDEKIAGAIVQAADEALAGIAKGGAEAEKWLSQWPVDVFQTGSATSTNMNTNEVLAGRANEILSGTRGGKKPVHPNDHVNKGQSSNDIIPTTLHVAALDSLENDLIPALKYLHAALAAKAKEFDPVVKIGRTHMMDAVPVRLGQEFAGYTSQLEHSIARAESCRKNLAELAIGGTAVGTGLNNDPKVTSLVIQKLSAELKLPFKQAPNLFEALGARDAAVETSGQLKTIACSLMKIANDIRFLGSGPRCGIGEINLPDLQPGSSIMPGKVNPVMPEMLTMVACQVIGADAAITAGGLQGHFELNVFKPMIAHNLLFSMQILSTGCRAFADKCVKGLEANKERCEELIEKSLMMCTALAPKIGYDKSAELAKEAYKTGKTVRQLATEKNLMPKAELDKLLDVRSMTEPGA